MNIDYKTVVAFGLPILAICGGLYNMAYWDTFNLNGLELLDVSMLIRSFLYPFMTYVGAAFIGGAISTFVPSIFKNDFNFSNEETRFTSIANSPLKLLLWYLFWVLVVVIFYAYGNIYKWSSLAFFVGLPIAIALNQSGLLKNKITNNKMRITFWLATSMVITFSFATGKYKSELIEQNYKYQYITADMIAPIIKASNMDTLKLIGITDQKVIMTDLKNERIFIIRADKMDALVLREGGRWHHN